MIAAFFNIPLFFIYLYGFGYSLTRFFKKNDLEHFILRLGIGLGVFPVVGLLLNRFKIPLDWKIFLALALILPIYDYIRSFKFSQLRDQFSNIVSEIVRHKLLLMIFLACVALYCGGAFDYPWLEDTDSWFHAAGIKYVAVEKNVNVAPGMFQYIFPYPPGYDLLFGVLHQTSSSLYWTLKFFNGLIVSLSYLFFYVFINGFVKDSNKSLLATFLLFCIPCYLTHFIWAHSLIVAVFFPALYLTFNAAYDKRFIVPASIITAGIFLIQPTQSIKYVCLVFIVLFVMVCDKNARKMNIFIVIFSAVVLSVMLWWFTVLMNFSRMGLPLPDQSTPLGLSICYRSIVAKFILLFSASGGSATRSYFWTDYFFIPRINMINNPVGIGIVLSVLAIVGLIRTVLRWKELQHKKDVFSITMLFWSIFIFVGMNSETFNLPVGLLAYRFWMLFAIPVCFFAAEAVMFLMAKIKSDSAKMIFLSFVLIAVFLNSALPKIRTNTGRWPAGGGSFWTSRDEMEGYLWLRRNLEPDTKVFAYINSFFLIGFDMRNDFWTPRYQDSLVNLFEQELDQTHLMLKENNYYYLIAGKRERNFFGEERFYNKIKALREHPFFELLFTYQGDVWIFKLKS